MVGLSLSGRKQISSRPKIYTPACLTAVAALLVALSGPHSIAASIRGAARTTPQQGAIKVEVDFVQVDVTVTDERGRFVRDLGSDVFELYEDGTRQQISSFTLVDLPSGRGGITAGPVEGARVQPDVRSNDAQAAGRVYVIALDDLHVHPLRSARVKQAARQFVEQHFGPNDMAAVLYTSGRADASQEFTSDPSLLQRSIDKFVGRQMRSSVLERLEEYERRQGQRSRADLRLDRVADPTDVQRADQARRTLKTLASLGDLLYRAGSRRKAVLLLSEGIDYPLHEGIAQTASGLTTFTSPYAADVRRDLQAAVRSAARANLSIYSIDPRGLPGTGDEAIEVGSFPENPHLGLTPTAFEDEVRQAQDSLRIISEQTGGVASVASNEFDEAFERIVQDNGTYYMLGYRSSDTRKDDRFRRIEVRVNREGAKVRARSGYVAAGQSSDVRSELLAPAAEPSAALRHVLNSPIPGGTVPMRVFAAPFRGEKNASVSVGVEIDARRFQFAQQNGIYTGKVEVALVAFDERSRVKTGDRQAVMLQLKPETHKAVLAHGFRLLFRLNLQPGRYQLRAASHEPDTGATGSVFYDIDIPDFNVSPLTMSGLVLTVARAAQMPTARADPLFERVLSSPPTSLRSFRSQETLIALTEIYGSTDAARAGVDLVTTVRGADGRVRSTITDHAAAGEASQDGAFGYAVTIPLVDLPPGQYVLKVQARLSRAPGTVVFREVPFEIAPSDG